MRKSSNGAVAGRLTGIRMLAMRDSCKARANAMELMWLENLVVLGTHSGELNLGCTLNLQNHPWLQCDSALLVRTRL